MMLFSSLIYFSLIHVNLDFLRMYSVLGGFLEGIKMMEAVDLIALETKDVY